VKLSLSDGVVRRAASPLLSAFSSSWRFRIRHRERWHALHASRAPFVFLLWHETLLPLLWLHRHQGVSIVVSEGKEGRYLSEYATRLGYRTIPGSSTRGGARALLASVRALEDGGSVAFTPDGPLGPRREMKPGVVRAAQRAGAAILPLHAVAPSAWRFNSWDRMMVPRPLGLVEVRYGESFTVGPGDHGLADGIARCAASMEILEAEMSSDVATR
jgi:lysophospholipid acyltransferase (LPLAT)-like uncharacterized protein